VRFQAEAQGNNAFLTWRTANEINNEYFAVERSTDSQQFAEVGRVAGQGKATIYHYTDVPIGTRSTEKAYYRLRQVDHDGHSTYSPVQVITFGRLIATVQVYPNPVTTEVHTLLPIAGAHLSIHTLIGQLLAKTYTATTEGIIDTQQLPSGTYLILVQPDRGLSAYYKFIKQ
jgi:hypothetical protein